MKPRGGCNDMKPRGGCNANGRRVWRDTTAATTTRTPSGVLLTVLLSLAVAACAVGPQRAVVNAQPSAVSSGLVDGDESSSSSGATTRSTGLQRRSATVSADVVAFDEPQVAIPDQDDVRNAAAALGVTQLVLTFVRSVRVTVPPTTTFAWRSLQLSTAIDLFECAGPDVAARRWRGSATPELDTNVKYLWTFDGERWSVPSVALAITIAGQLLAVAAGLLLSPRSQSTPPPVDESQQPIVNAPVELSWGFRVSCGFHAVAISYFMPNVVGLAATIASMAEDAGSDATPGASETSMITTNTLIAMGSALVQLLIVAIGVGSTLLPAGCMATASDAGGAAPPRPLYSRFVGVPGGAFRALVRPAMRDGSWQCRAHFTGDQVAAITIAAAGSLAYSTRSQCRFAGLVVTGVSFGQAVYFSIVRPFVGTADNVFAAGLALVGATVHLTGVVAQSLLGAVPTSAAATAAGRVAAIAFAAEWIVTVAALILSIVRPALFNSLEEAGSGEDVVVEACPPSDPNDPAAIMTPEAAALAAARRAEEEERDRRAKAAASAWFTAWQGGSQPSENWTQIRARFRRHAEWLRFRKWQKQQARTTTAEEPLLMLSRRPSSQQAPPLDGAEHQELISQPPPVVPPT